MVLEVESMTVDRYSDAFPNRFQRESLDLVNDLLTLSASWCQAIIVMSPIAKPPRLF